MWENRFSNQIKNIRLVLEIASFKIAMLDLLDIYL